MRSLLTELNHLKETIDAIGQEDPTSWSIEVIERLHKLLFRLELARKQKQSKQEILVIDDMISTLRKAIQPKLN